MVRLGPVLTAISSYTTARSLSSVTVVLFTVSACFCKPRMRECRNTNSQFRLNISTKGHDRDRRGSIEMQVVQLPASTSSNQAVQGCVRAHHVKRMPHFLRTDRCPRRFSKGHIQFWKATHRISWLEVFGDDREAPGIALPPYLASAPSVWRTSPSCLIRPRCLVGQRCGNTGPQGHLLSIPSFIS